jgi:hypothetical protein
MRTMASVRASGRGTKTGVLSTLADGVGAGAAAGRGALHAAAASMESGRTERRNIMKE